MLWSTRRIRTLALSVLAVFYLTAGKANASSIFFGEDINSTATGANENAIRISHPNADAAQSSFFAHLQGVATEAFEGFAPNSNVTTLTFGGDTATLSPSLTVLNQPTGTMNGVYPISGNKILLQAVGASSTFSITFNHAQAAFGFYTTDIEIPGNLNLRFLLADGSTIVRPVPTQAGTGGANNTGSVAFYGLIDTSNPFTRVSFIRSLNSNDGFGFDDMTIGRVENVSLVPEPSIVWLFGTGLACLASLRLTRHSSRRVGHMLFVPDISMLS